MKNKSISQIKQLHRHNIEMMMMMMIIIIIIITIIIIIS
jgi:uncharacterized membrane-anchored protein